MRQHVETWRWHPHFIHLLLRLFYNPFGCSLAMGIFCLYLYYICMRCDLWDNTTLLLLSLQKKSLRSLKMRKAKDFFFVFLEEKNIWEGERKGIQKWRERIKKICLYFPLFFFIVARTRTICLYRTFTFDLCETMSTLLWSFVDFSLFLSSVSLPDSLFVCFLSKKRRVGCGWHDGRRWKYMILM